MGVWYYTKLIIGAELSADKIKQAMGLPDISNSQLKRVIDDYQTAQEYLPDVDEHILSRACQLAEDFSLLYIEDEDYNATFYTIVIDYGEDRMVSVPTKALVKDIASIDYQYWNKVQQVLKIDTPPQLISISYIC